MFTTNAKRITFSCLAVLLASCGSPQADTAAQNQAEPVAGDQQAADLQAAAVTREFVKTCIKMGGDQDKIAVAMTKVAGAPNPDPKLGNSWEHKIDGKTVQVTLGNSTYKNKPTKDCSIIVEGAKSGDLQAQLAKQTQAKRFGASITGGKHERMYTLDDAGNNFMIVASEEKTNGQVKTALTSRLTVPKASVKTAPAKT